jgi:hypothetical protein
MGTTRYMEMIESVSWVALGFAPTLLILETYDRLTKGIRKSILRVGKVPTLITA